MALWTANIWQNHLWPCNLLYLKIINCMKIGQLLVTVIIILFQFCNFPSNCCQLSGIPLIMRVRNKIKNLSEWDVGDNNSLLLHLSDPISQADHLSISDRIVFVRQSNQSFSAKIQVRNLSLRNVSYKLRSSNRRKFSMKSGFGFVQPRSTCEVVVSSTNLVKNFEDILKESFCLYAVPIYDKRRLEKRILNVLWQAHGTDIFPYKMTEVHHIPYVLPKSDHYLDHLSILGRIGNLNRILSPTPIDIFLEQRKEGIIDEETFHFHWSPYPSSNTDPDPTLEGSIKEFRKLAKEIHKTTEEIVQNTKATLGGIVCGFFGLAMIASSSYWGWIDFLPKNDRPPQVVEPEEEANFISSLFSRLSNWWNN